MFVCVFVCDQVVRRQDISNSIAPIFMKVCDFVEGLACIAQGPIFVEFGWKLVGNFGWFAYLTITFIFLMFYSNYH